MGQVVGVMPMLVGGPVASEYHGKREYGRCFEEADERGERDVLPGDVASYMP